MKIQKVKFWKLPVYQDSRGGLCAIEWKELPFRPKRVYFLYEVKGLRGGHAHKKEKEVFVCIQGKFRGRIHDGKRFKSFVFKKPGQALYTANLIWHGFDKFSKNALMLALSSTSYEGEKGYIMKFEEFRKLKKA